MKKVSQITDCWWIPMCRSFYRLSNLALLSGNGFFSYLKKVKVDYYTVSLWRRIDDPPVPYGLLRYHKKYGAMHVQNIVSKEMTDNEYLMLTPLQLELMKRLWMDQLKRFKKLHKIKYDPKTNMPMRLLNRRGDAEPDPQLTQLAKQLYAQRLTKGKSTVLNQKTVGAEPFELE